MQCKQSILCLKKVKNVGQTIQSVDIKKDKCHVMSHKSMTPFTLVALRPALDKLTLESFHKLSLST